MSTDNQVDASSLKKLSEDDLVQLVLALRRRTRKRKRSWPVSDGTDTLSTHLSSETEMESMI